ncbi:MAG: ribulose-phosphate 3-epimerase [Parcubacteria group bacterium Gr01-1014_2]|nr:MAG: ribulose-phosphate 3-epimerase [Parcubacteria group bacterium Gr01-1014_2]
MIKIIPAILAKTYEEFESMVKKVEPYTDLVHLDIADGGFVSNKTIDGYEELEKIDTKLNFEVHLMVNSPETVISNWSRLSDNRGSSTKSGLESGSQKIIRFLIHWEAASDFDFLINEINIAGREVGCVFNPKTDYSVIEPYINRISLVQFMTVDPGFYGSLFLPEVLDKIRDFHIRYPGKQIQVDGGIKPETLKLVESAGVDRAAVGSYIFQSDNLEKALKELEASNV